MFFIVPSCLSTLQYTNPRPFFLLLLLLLLRLPPPPLFFIGTTWNWGTANARELWQLMKIRSRMERERKTHIPLRHIICLGRQRAEESRSSDWDWDNSVRRSWLVHSNRLPFHVPRQVSSRPVPSRLKRDEELVGNQYTGLLTKEHFLKENQLHQIVF